MSGLTKKSLSKPNHKVATILRILMEKNTMLMKKEDQGLSGQGVKWAISKLVKSAALFQIFEYTLYAQCFVPNACLENICCNELSRQYLGSAMCVPMFAEWQKRFNHLPILRHLKTHITGAKFNH